MFIGLILQIKINYQRNFKVFSFYFKVKSDLSNFCPCFLLVLSSLSFKFCEFLLLICFFNWFDIKVNLHGKFASPPFLSYFS